MKLYPDSKVYVFCPGNIQTGGPESLHQLASQLITFGVRTAIFYGNPVIVPFNPDDPVHDAFKKYHVPYVHSVEDNAKNVKVIPETVTVELCGGKNIRNVLWWMSVDNYFNALVDTIQSAKKNPLAEKIPNLFNFYNADKNIEHWGQSEYVCQFLRLNDLTKIKSVETPMSQIFLERAANVDLSRKKNFVAFNPKKGFEITQQLINLAPDIDWRPIKNMTPEQVQELLAAAKIYIDFGEFPGRERLPREATLSGCVVITGRRGAAANDVDINIPAEFKFDEQTTRPQQVIEKIRETFENFVRALDKQKAFREKELNARKNFAAQVADAFEINWSPPPTVAFTQDVSEKSFLLAQTFFKSKKFFPAFIVDDVVARANISDKLLVRQCNRNFLRVENNFVEVITADDAKFLYHEGRIKNFALFEPTDAELDALKNFYKPNYSDVLILSR